MDFEIRRYVPEDGDEDEEMKIIYDTINDLVNVAGNVTLRALFTEPKTEFPPRVVNVVHKALEIGLFGLGNGYCRNIYDTCEKSEKRHWCLNTEYGAALWSSKCVHQ